ncbi:MAG: RNA polymerase sigma factor [Agathobacter sp.]
MDYELYDDKQIVDGILSNDKQLIGYFFNKKCSKLLSYIILNVFDGHVDQRALVSELFLHLAKDNWYKVRQFDFRSKLMTWLSVVAVRFFQKKREELIEKCSADALNNKLQCEWHTPSLSIEQKMDIRAALQKMPNERYRKVIEVLDLQEVRPELLAEEMNITVDNLYNIHRRARVQLRLIMGRKEDYYD